MAITERGLAAVLATDVYNFSKMMGENEELTIENLRTCRELIENSVLFSIEFRSSDDAVRQFQGVYSCSLN